MRPSQGPYIRLRRDSSYPGRARGPPEEVPQSSPTGPEPTVDPASAQVLDAIPDAVLVLGSELILHANRSALQLFGADDTEQLNGLRLSVLAPTRDQPDRMSALSNLEQNEARTLRIRTLEDRFCDVELRWSTTQWGADLAQLAILRPLGTADDPARAARDEHGHFKALIGAMPGVAYLRSNDETRGVQWVSPTVEGLTGHTAQEFLQNELSFVELCHPDDAAESAQLVGSALKAQQPFQLQYRLRHTDGSWSWVEEYGCGIWNDQGKLSHIVGSLTDISGRLHAKEERESYRTRLQEARKLEDLGSMTGAIAHQFNNLLTSILGNAHIAKSHINENSQAQACMEGIVDSVRRATRLTLRMQACSDDDALSLRTIDMSALLLEHTELLRSTLPEGISFLVTKERDELWVEGAPGQLEECLASLVQNASESHPNERGLIQVHMGHEHLDEDSARSLLPPRPLDSGEYAYIEVSDRGTGMSTEVERRMFEPFYSTKFTGRGLGLAVCMGAARRHRGGFRVTSTIGVGSSVRMYVPLSARRPRRPEPPLREAQSQSAALVLVVDDERAVRDIAAEALEHAGFRPLLASNGDEALRIAREHKSELALAVLDRVMPGRSGESIMHELRTDDADLPVLMISGYGGPGDTALYDDDGVEFLQKPFGPSQLANRCADLARAPVTKSERL